MEVIEVYKKYYTSVLDELPKDKRAFLDKDIKADKYFLVFEGAPIGGFAVNTNGELTGLFSLRKGIGEELFHIRMEYAKKYSTSTSYKLSCIGNRLRDLFRNYGFKVTEEVTWDDTLSPPNWNYSKYGRPKIYYMSFHG